MVLIEQLLEGIPPDGRQLRVDFARHEAGYVVRAMLTLRTGNFVAQTDTPVQDGPSAVDQVVDKLAAEVQQHEATRGRRSPACRQLSERELAASAPPA